MLAGGKSVRLGAPKALEMVNKRRLIDRVIESLYSVTPEVLVVTSEGQFSSIDSFRLKAKTIVDLYPDKAALGGIYTGLKSADTFYSLVVACDMPFINSALLHYLLDLAPGFDAVVPKVDDVLESLHAVYSKNCLSPMKQLLDKNELEVSRLFNLVKTRYVEKDEIAQVATDFLSFFNVNTKDDLIEAETLVDIMKDKSL